MTASSGRPARRGPVLPHPSLYGVTIDVTPAGGSCGVLQCGFYQERHNWLGLKLVELCLVRIVDRPDTAAVVSHGTYSARRYRRMAAVKEYPLPTRLLELDDLAVEPADVCTRALRLVRSTADSQPRIVGFALTRHKGELVWQGHVDLPGQGMLRFMLSAATGEVLLDAFDRYHSE